MNNYMKLLVDLDNVDVVIEEEDKALILLSSLSDEHYKTVTPRSRNTYPDACTDFLPVLFRSIHLLFDI